MVQMVQAAVRRRCDTRCGRTSSSVALVSEGEGGRAMSSFEEWDSFYLIVGGAAGALIGLQFVVMTLLADRPRLASREAGAAFSTPTVVHFATALLLAAIMRMPWHGAAPAAMCWGAVSLVAFVYALGVIRRVRTQTAYRPDFDDWCFYVIIPIFAYAALGVSAFTAGSYERESLFAVAGATVVLLFVGIHNSWDAIAYHVLVARQRAESTPHEDVL